LSLFGLCLELCLFFLDEVGEVGFKLEEGGTL
jgi:hypothetical protein